MSDTAEEIDDGIDLLDLDDEAFETRLAQIDKQLEDNKENDGDVDEHKALLEQRTEVRQQQQAATEERETRQKGVREAMTDYRVEATKLDARLAAGDLTPDDEFEVRARLAFVTDRRITLEHQLPFAGITTARLEAQCEDIELEREELWAELKAAEDNRGRRPAHHRKVERAYDALRDKHAALKTELDNRQQREVVADGYHRMAIADAERELRAEDAKAISEAEPGRTGTRTEDLAETFDARLALRVPIVEQGLWRKVERRVGHQMIDPSNIQGANIAARERRQADEKKIEERKEKVSEQAANSQ